MPSPAINLLQILTVSQTGTAVEGIQSGLLPGGAFEGLIDQLAGDADAKPTVVPTGGVLPTMTVVPPGQDEYVAALAALDAAASQLSPDADPAATPADTASDDQDPAGDTDDITQADLLASLLVPTVPPPPPAQASGTVAPAATAAVEEASALLETPIPPLPVRVQAAAPAIADVPDDLSQSSALSAEMPADGASSDDVSLVAHPNVVTGGASRHREGGESGGQQQQPQGGFAIPIPAATTATVSPEGADDFSDVLGVTTDGASLSASRPVPAPAPAPASTVPFQASLADAAAPAAQRAVAAVHHAPVMEQVTMRVRRAAEEGGSHISVQLEPADLGRVDIRFDTASDGRTTVTVTADREDTLGMLQRDSRNLERVLQDSGIRADSGSLSFHLRQNGQDQQFAQGQQQRFHVPVPEDALTQPADSTEALPVLRLSDKQLDIRI